MHGTASVGLSVPRWYNPNQTPIGNLDRSQLVMRQIRNRRLWLGHVGDLREVRAIFSAGIEAVVELAASEPGAVLPRDLIHLRFPLTDGGGNEPWSLRLAVQSVAGLLEAGVPTLVCCSAGMSRSVVIAAAAIAVSESRTLDDALSEVVAKGPADVSAGLIRQVAAAMASAD